MSINLLLFVFCFGTVYYTFTSKIGVIQADMSELNIDLIVPGHVQVNSSE